MNTNILTLKPHALYSMVYYAGNGVPFAIHSFFEHYPDGLVTIESIGEISLCPISSGTQLYLFDEKKRSIIETLKVAKKRCKQYLKTQKLYKEVSKQCKNGVGKISKEDFPSLFNDMDGMSVRIGLDEVGLYERKYILASPSKDREHIYIISHKFLKKHLSKCVDIDSNLLHKYAFYDYYKTSPNTLDTKNEMPEDYVEYFHDHVSSVMKSLNIEGYDMERGFYVELVDAVYDITYTLLKERIDTVLAEQTFYFMNFSSTLAKYINIMDEEQ